MKCLIVFSCCALFALAVQANVHKTTKECGASVTTVSGTHKTEICSGGLIFEDNFDTLDVQKWEHESTLGGGGNWEFQWYTNNRTSSYVQDGNLVIKPVLTSDATGEGFLTSGTLDLNGGAPADACTNAAFYGCIRAGGPDNVINPVKSARLRTVNSFNFKYGRVEIRAKMPSGDWLWPAIWMMPRYNAYGGWPSSGEIDIVESRGNADLMLNGVNIGNKQVGSTLHYGPDYGHNGWERAHGDINNAAGWNNEFHTYELLWTQDSLKMSVDGQQIGLFAPPAGGFWQLGDFEAQGVKNPWKGQDKMAPFNQEYYIILNLAVGGTNFFNDAAVNANGKPWSNNSPKASTDFWNGRESWLKTWDLQGSDNAALQVDYVRVYAL